MISTAPPSKFPGLTLKAWALLQCNGAASTTLIRGFNVTSASRLGVGQHQIVYTNNLSGQQMLIGTHNANLGSAYVKAGISNNGNSVGSNLVGTAASTSDGAVASSDITGQVYLEVYD